MNEPCLASQKLHTAKKKGKKMKVISNEKSKSVTHPIKEHIFSKENNGNWCGLRGLSICRWFHKHC